MYKVYCDGATIYDPRLPNREIFDANVELELNKTGSFNFTIYPTHKIYEDKDFDPLRQMKSIITVTQDDELIFRGRILNLEQGFHNEKYVACEGELAFLLDSVIEPEGSEASPIGYDTPRDYLNKLISRHNELMADNTEKHFTVGNISDALNDKTLSIAESDYKTTWELITEKVIDVLGGYIWVRHEGGTSYIDYLTEPDVPSNQAIRFGKNLLDLRKTIKGEDIATGIVPISKNDSGSQITCGFIRTDNKDVLDALGVIYKVVEFEDITDESELEEKAKEHLRESIKFSTMVELTAADLSGIADGVKPFRLGQKLAVVDSYHGLNELAEESGTELLFLVKKLTIDLLNPTNNKLTVGTTFSTLTEKQNASVSSQSKTAKTVSKIEKQTSTFATKETLNSYYKKEETDKTFATKETLNSYYTKEETDETFAAKTAVETLANTVKDLLERIAALEEYHKEEQEGS